MFLQGRIFVPSLRPGRENRPLCDPAYSRKLILLLTPFGDLCLSRHVDCGEKYSIWQNREDRGNRLP